MKSAILDTKCLIEKFPLLYGEVSDAQIERYNILFERFKSAYGVDRAYFASSSGRVEVCGNHTDHNGGKVVSCAISLDTLATFLPTDNGIINIKSEGYPDIVVDINGEEVERVGTSPALVRGVVVGMQKRGYSVGGFNACFTSNVLGGAGISSSASFEVLIAEILNFLYNDDKIDCEEKAKIAQFSENVYFNKPCGLLDQTAIAFGGLNMLDFFDKNKISVTKIDNSLSDYTLILINTGGSHANLTDEYASIPQEMFAVAKELGAERLADAGEQKFYNELPKLYNKLPDRAILRAIHFFEENARVDYVYDSLINEDYDCFLQTISLSGLSSMYKLQNCYVAGCKEQPIPKALQIAKRAFIIGANRVHGGGFAGSILNIVKNDEVQSFMDYMKNFFAEKDIIPLKVRSVGTIVL